VDFTDLTGVSINFFHSQFSQSYGTLNGVTITQTSDQYHYSSYLEILIYGTDAAAMFLLNAYWYLDTGDMQPSEPSANILNATTNRGFITGWNRLSARRENQH